jgi:type IV secretory pathway TraG/TraD family ATPase VirD4
MSFPRSGRLDFFETSLAFMAGYGIRAFLISQSLNQIEKAYGDHNSILDNCHVRVAFATNDDRTAKRLSDTLGTTTEQRAMRNYAGHRLAPWLAHVMVSRQETARQLLTPGEVMQLPPHEELVLVSGLAPIRADKLRYYLDPNFTERVLPAPRPQPGPYADRPAERPNNGPGWYAAPMPASTTGPAMKTRRRAACSSSPSPTCQNRLCRTTRARARRDRSSDRGRQCRRGQAGDGAGPAAEPGGAWLCFRREQPGHPGAGVLRRP